MIYQKFEKPSCDFRNNRKHTLGPLEKHRTFASEAHMTRRAVVSRVIRVQRRYAVQIRPMESIDFVHFRQIFELFIEQYRICTHFSHIEYVLRIHLVKIS